MINLPYVRRKILEKLTDHATKTVSRKPKRSTRDLFSCELLAKPSLGSLLQMLNEVFPGYNVWSGPCMPTERSYELCQRLCEEAVEQGKSFWWLAVENGDVALEIQFLWTPDDDGLTAPHIPTFATNTGPGLLTISVSQRELKPRWYTNLSRIFRTT